MQVGIWLSLLICLMAIIGCIWQLANIRGYKSRGRRRSRPTIPTEHAPQTRRSDKRKLSRQEKKLLVEAQRLVQSGKATAASRVYEQLSMPREAIQVLEDSGLIHEAAKILMRMQRHNRAGVIYARHGMWEFAAQCFKMADMPLEMGKCYKELGDLQTAGECFERAERFEEAAECYEKSGDFHRAALIHMRLGKRKESMRLYNKLAQSSENSALIQLADQEISNIIAYLSEGHTEPGLSDVVVGRNKLTEVIINLVSKDMARQAAELYLRATADVGAQLIADVNYQNKSAECLAEVFLTVSQFHYAGMVFERMNQFEKAADAFEKAEDIERAIYCYERSGNRSKVRQLKDKNKANRSPSSTKTDDSEPAKNFAASPAEDTHLLNNTPQKQQHQEQRSSHSPPTQQAGMFTLKFDDSSPRILARSEGEHLEETHTPAEPSKLSLDENKSFFHKSNFLEDFSFDQKEKLWEIGQSQDFPEEKIILNYGDQPLGIYLVLKGRVACYRKNNRSETMVDRILERDYFGEFWLLTDNASEVKFVVERDAIIHIIQRTAFTQLLESDGILARKIYKRFTERLMSKLMHRNPATTDKKAAS